MSLNYNDNPSANDPQHLAEDTEFGNLINFANLEMVMTQMLKKFKGIERSQKNTDEAFTSLRHDIDLLATATNLNGLASESHEKFQRTNRVIDGLKEQMKQIEAELERNRFLCGNLEAQVEATSKEKALQDDVIREMQASLHDKVPLSELRLFDTKFGGYTTKREHQELTNKLIGYTTSEVTERLAEQLRELGTRFEGYTRTARIEQQLQDIRDWVFDELTNYANLNTTQHKMEEISKQVRETGSNVSHLSNIIEDRIRAISDRITSLYMETNREIAQRAFSMDLNLLREELDKYALRVDTDAFIADVGPKMRFCSESIQVFDQRINAQDDAIHRVDEVLLDKAAKYDIIVTNAKIDKCFEKEKALHEFQNMYDRLDWMRERLDQYIDAEEERLSSFKPADYMSIFEEMRNRIEMKADKAELLELHQIKANRIDAEAMQNFQDVVHRQIEYLSVTTLGLAKLALTEEKASDNKSLRVQQKSQVLMQAESLWNWVLRNQTPPSIQSQLPPAASAEDSKRQPSAPQGSSRPASTGGLRLSMPPLSRTPRMAMSR